MEAQIGFRRATVGIQRRKNELQRMRLADFMTWLRPPAPGGVLRLTDQDRARSVGEALNRCRKRSGWQLREAVDANRQHAVVGNRWKEIAARDAMTTEGARGGWGEGTTYLGAMF